MRWSADDIARITGGRVCRTFTVSGAAIDSRKITPGCLFIALKGERADGHAFVQRALESGAAGALVSHIPAGMENAALVLVGDVFTALNALAVDARMRAASKIVAVTGSVGKTGTKEMLRLALGAAGSVYATEGNLNNHIGVPLSLVNMPEEAAYAVFELGMNHAGEIAQLARLVQPHAAVITNVESVHLEFFGSEEGIADAKAEIFEGVKPGGAAVLNADNRHYARLRAKAEAQGLDVIAFGTDTACDAQLQQAEVRREGTQVKARINGAELAWWLGAFGVHWGLSSVAAVAAASVAGVQPAAAASALSAFCEPKGRGCIKTIRAGGKPLFLIDDSYNASPASMCAAFVRLADAGRVFGASRLIAVLGDMLELGETAPALHAALAETLRGQRIDLVFTAGPLMRHLHDALPEAMRGAHAVSTEALLPLLLPALQGGDAVLVKGSNGSRTGLIVSALEQEEEVAHAV